MKILLGLILPVLSLTVSANEQSETFLKMNCADQIVYENSYVQGGPAIYICSNDSGRFEVIDPRACVESIHYENNYVDGGPAILTCEADNLKALNNPVAAPERVSIEGKAAKKIFNNLPSQNARPRMICTADVPTSYCESTTNVMGSLGQMSINCSKTTIITGGSGDRYSCILE